MMQKITNVTLVKKTWDDWQYMIILIKQIQNITNSFYLPLNTPYA